MIQTRQLEEILEDDGIIFLTYGGFFTQSIISGMTEVLEKEVTESNLPMKISHNIYVVFIELAQNIMNYSKKLKDSGKFDPKGLIYVGKQDNEYFVISQNIISLEDKNKLEPILKNIQKLSKDEIKQLYRKTRREGKEKHSKGGGLGFLEIAKKVSSIEFQFEKIQEQRYYFKFYTTLIGEKSV
jgi:hypothetical protein